MADAYLAGIDKDIFLDWSGGGTLVADSDHRTRYISALKQADGYEFGALAEFIRALASKGGLQSFATIVKKHTYFTERTLKWREILSCQDHITDMRARLSHFR